MKQKLLAAASIAAVVVGGLTACSSGSASAEPTIKLWLPPLGTDAEFNEEQAWDDILAPFEKEHGLNVKVTIVSWTNYEEKFLTGISSGSGPDIGYMYTEMMGDYIKQGAVVAFNKYLTADSTADMLYLNQGQIEGKQYALPFVVGGARVVYANRAILEAAGVTDLPSTWGEYLDASAAVAAAGYTPTVQPWGSPDRGMLNDTFFPALWQAGGNLFTDDGSATAFDSDAGVAAATFIHDQLASGFMPSDVTGLSPEEAMQQFLDGKVAFWSGADSKVAPIEEAGVDYGIIDSLRNVDQGTFIASDSLVLLDACKDKQLCTDLVTFILAGPQMEQFHAFGAYPPIASDETVPGDSVFAKLYATPEILHSLPIVPGGSATYNAIYTNLQQMMLGQKTPEEAIRDAAAEGDAALTESK